MMLELWLSRSLPAGARAGGQGGSSVSLLDPPVAVSGLRRLASSSFPATRVSETVCSDLSSFASCAVSHDCLVWMGGKPLRDGRDPMVGRGMW